MNKVYLLTGGNMGDRMHYLLKAAQAIEKNCGKILSRSSVYETEAWGVNNQAAFLNQALLVQTPLTATQLLKIILTVEEALGRIRKIKYGPRVIDIDILLFNDAIVDMPGLTVPHPQMQNRRFVLEPLHEIAPLKMHPVLQKNISQLLKECPDILSVKKNN